MRKNKKKIIFVALILAAAGAFYFFKIKPEGANTEVIKEVKPVLGAIRNIISSTGTVLPKNRLEVKPPVNGRIEEIRVQEGDIVKAGSTLAWMSSTERAALLDAARGQGEETLKYWVGVYKAIPLISPIDAEVIVAKTQPGQTVTTSDAVIVLSDELIVRAQVDETDIGKIKIQQEAVIILDAYPDTKIKAKVDHIYYESKTVNNVTIYEVDLVAQDLPEFLRSGMNATVNFIEKNKENSLLLPAEAVIREKEATYVYVKQAGGVPPVKREVKLGISENKNVEILSGIGSEDTVVVKTKKYALPASNEGSNPFMPSRRR
ncbi:MAG: HlyD family efflux transporter periplasmic adaptor subunit [Candidatus Omnitrophota bacterium]